MYSVMYVHAYVQMHTYIRTAPGACVCMCVHKDTVCVHCVQMEPIVRDMQHASQGVRVRGKAHLGKSKPSASPSFSGGSLPSE